MWPAIIGAIGAIAGSYLTSQGMEESNERNVQLSRDTTQFNAQQAEQAQLFSANQASIGRDWSAGQAELNRQFTSGQAQSQMDFQERMSGSSYQRAVADMQSAGLNPMLAYSQGGASSPSGASGSGFMPSAPVGSGHQASGVQGHVESERGPGLLSGLAVARTVSDLMSEEQNRNIKEPLKEIASEALGVIKALKSAIGPMGESLSRLVSDIEDKVKGASVSGGAAVEKVRDAVGVVENAAAQVKETVRRGVSGVSSSAGSAVSGVRDRVERVLEETRDSVGKILHGERGVEAPVSRGKVPRDAQRQRVFEPSYKWDVR